jgi:predicted SAM-dependent methyltransferase
LVARECFRVLQKRGILRVAVPNLNIAVNEYLQDQDPLASHRFLRRLSLGRTFRDLVHPGANHSQMFDERSLVHLFREAGFPGPEVKTFLESGIDDIAAIELQERKHETLYVESMR